MPGTDDLTATTVICGDPGLSATRVHILTTFETEGYVARTLYADAKVSSARTSRSRNSTPTSARWPTARRLSCPVPGAPSSSASSTRAPGSHLAPRHGWPRPWSASARSWRWPPRAGPIRRSLTRAGSPADRTHRHPARFDETAGLRPRPAGCHRLPDRSRTALSPAARPAGAVRPTAGTFMGRRSGALDPVRERVGVDHPPYVWRRRTPCTRTARQGVDMTNEV